MQHYAIFHRGRSSRGWITTEHLSSSARSSVSSSLLNGVVESIPGKMHALLFSSSASGWVPLRGLEFKLGKANLAPSHFASFDDAAFGRQRSHAIVWVAPFLFSFISSPSISNQSKRPRLSNPASILCLPCSVLRSAWPLPAIHTSLFSITPSIWSPAPFLLLSGQASSRLGSQTQIIQHG